MSSKRSWRDGPNDDETLYKCIKAQKLMSGRNPLSQRNAADRFNIPKSTFNRFLAGKNVGKKGPTLFTESDLQGVLAVVTNRALQINALSKADVKKLFQEALLKKRGRNALADLDTFAPIDDRTLNKYMEMLKITEKQGKIKPVSRKEPFLNI